VERTAAKYNAEENSTKLLLEKLHGPCNQQSYQVLVEKIRSPQGFSSNGLAAGSLVHVQRENQQQGESKGDMVYSPCLFGAGVVNV